jgi:hypothetical protein
MPFAEIGCVGAAPFGRPDLTLSLDRLHTCDLRNNIGPRPPETPAIADAILKL